MDNNKKIRWAINSPKRSGDGYRWAYLFLLYEDGTYEIIFEYRWTDPRRERVFDTSLLKGRTREDAIYLLGKAYYSGKIDGWLNE